MTNRIPSILALGILILIAIIVGGFALIDKRIKSDIAVTQMKQSKENVNSFTDDSADQDIKPADWKRYENRKYKYNFKYPPNANIGEIEKETFLISSDEYEAGKTPEDKYIEYGGEICLTINHGLGYINISAPENYGFIHAICGRTGVGCANMTAGTSSEDVITSRTENIEIDGRVYTAEGSEIDCPSSDDEIGEHSEFFKVELENNTRIEYGSIGSGLEGLYEDYLGRKDEILEILSSIEFME